MIFGSVIVSFGFFTALAGVILVVALIIGSQWPSAMTQFPAQPPRWALEMPGGLEPAALDVLFQQGQNDMRDGNHRTALLNFYRILKEEPGRPYVDKFAFAAGEFLVVETLAKELQHRVEQRQIQEKERDQFLLDAREGARSMQLRAQNKLKRLYPDDPIVIKQLGLKPTATMIAREKLSAEGTARLQEEKFDEASKAFQDVLDSAKDPAERAQAVTNLRAAQLALARQSTDKWAQATMQAAMSNDADARSLFGQLKTEHPAHPSAQVHLTRLP